VKSHLLEEPGNFLACGRKGLLELLIFGRIGGDGLDDAVEVTLLHRQCATDEIAEVSWPSPR
jgi:hypothetical protein